MDDPLEEHILTFEGNDYRVTVTYKDDAGIPKGAQLVAQEILPDPGPQEDGDTVDEYDVYMSMTREALNLEAGAFAYARFLDIMIVDESGSKVEIDAPVDVRIILKDKEDSAEAENSTKVVHFADGAEYGDVVEHLEVEGDEVSFEAEGFSAYAIVEGPEDVPSGWHMVSSMEEFMAWQSTGLYIGHIDGYYFTNSSRKEGTRTGIIKTKPPRSYPSLKAVEYYFESAGEGKVYAYCLNQNGDRQYVCNDGSNSLSFAGEEDKTAFTISVNSSGQFTLNNGQWYWNMQGGETGSRFCSYNVADDRNNLMYLWYYDEGVTDPYELDGMTYGLMSWDGNSAGKAMMADQDGNALCAEAMEVMRTSDNTGHLFVRDDSDITLWTFEWASEDRYYLYSDDNGSRKYLKIASSGPSLVNAKEETEPVQIAPGRGEHEGEIAIETVNLILTYSGSVQNGFTVSSSGGSEWLHFVELTEVTDEYVRPYTAHKISISDDALSAAERDEDGNIRHDDDGNVIYRKDKARVVVYTPVWNETLKKYEYYVIDGDGGLLPCKDAGNSIKWISGETNEALWEFTEYTNKDGTPNGYYELYNPSTGKYIAPQISGGQILSEEPVGINLYGRRNGRYYSTVLAWDDFDYSYAGLCVEDGQLKAGPEARSMDFYVAVMEETSADDVLHTVPTLDHTQYGITMKLADRNSRKEMSNFLGDDSGGVTTDVRQGLLSTNLGPDGYPVAAGGSLGTLYAGEKEVNHLFIESTYKGSGYYEYNSAQNFASLKGNDGGDFTVYEELGTEDADSERPTLKHGQFYPYNDISAGVFAKKHKENLYSVTGEELPNSDPRKYEKLHLVPRVNFYFAMELEAKLMQTPSGLDEWGHDIIFEFTGDDDFWLYVDGELVIDLGGIHSAVPGSVNFRNGRVMVNGTPTTLKDLFYQNYIARGHSDAEAEAYVADKFVQNEDGDWVFEDYTMHTMSIFYMERGGAASNLHMRFNLAAVKPGTVELSKALRGIDAEEQVPEEYAYQIWYKKKNDPNYYLLSDLPLLEETEIGAKPASYVTYKNTDTAVRFMPQYTVDGISYEKVYFLKPGETAVILFPVFGEEKEEIESYYIRECGVNTETYSSVYVNGDEIEGTPVGGSGSREDFRIPDASIAERSKVLFENEISPDAARNLTITKRLYDHSGNYSEEHALHGDPTVFKFRLYLGAESDTAPVLAYRYTYHVLDRNMEYCTWDAAHQSFVSTGKTQYGDLTPQEKEEAAFKTSVNGTISKIPADYTVLIRDLPAGTGYRVEERPSEIPDGYSFGQYRKDESARIVEDGSGVPGVEDTIIEGRDSNVEICNRKSTSGKVTIRKVDNEKKPLIGAKFQLYKFDSVWKKVEPYMDEIDMTTVSEFELSDLSQGLYRLEETRSPDGFVILKKYAYFAIAPDNSIRLTDETGEGDNTNEKVSLDTTDGCAVVIENTPGIELPSTGGIGTRILYYLGTVLVLAAGIGFAYRVRYCT